MDSSITFPPTLGFSNDVHVLGRCSEPGWEAGALTPATRSSNGVQSPRLIRNTKSRCRMQKRLATGFELSTAGESVICERPRVIW